MLNPCCPSVSIARERIRRGQIDGRLCVIEAIDEFLPGDIDAQILRLVNDPRTICEGDDLYGTAVIVRIGKAAVEPAHSPVPAYMQYFANERQVGINPRDEFA